MHQRSGLVGIGALADGAHIAADGHRAARATGARADAVGGTTSFSDGDAVHVVGDGNVTARGIIAAANGSRIFSSMGCDGTSIDNDVATVGVNRASTNARSVAGAAGGE